MIEFPQRLPEFDERRELWRLLESAAPRVRLQWLAWCCKQASAGGVEIRVVRNDGSVGEVWHDAVSLFGTLDVHRAGKELEGLVRRSQRTARRPGG